jgi:hypothetical protein
MKSDIYLSIVGLLIFLTSFTLVGRWFIFRKLQVIASDIFLFSCPLSLKLVVFKLSAIVEKVSLGDFAICLALFIILSFVLHGHPLFNFGIPAPILLLSFVSLCAIDGLQDFKSSATWVILPLQNFLLFCLHSLLVT